MAQSGSIMVIVIHGLRQHASMGLTQAAYFITPCTGCTQVLVNRVSGSLRKVDGHIRLHVMSRQQLVLLSLRVTIH